MLENSNYEYSSTDLLKNPQKYRRSTYEGPCFLVSYNWSRNNILKILNDKNSTNHSLKEIILNLGLTLFSNYFNKLSKNEINTTNLLSSILSSIDIQQDESLINYVIDVFVRKFEINKKIFLSYDKDFKEISNNYSNLQNYLLLSVICLLQYTKTKNLKFINASLKLNDVICSRIQIIKDEFDISLFKIILNMELTCISDLCKNKGIILK